MRVFALVFAAIVAAAACSAFGDGKDSEPATEAGAPDGTGGGDATSDGGACPRGGRDGGNTCGTATCVKGQTCCLNGSPPICLPVNDCPTVQVNCVSPNECGANEVCCQAGPNTSGTACRQSCSFGVPLCTKDTDCQPGEYCREPSPSEQIAHWHCTACSL